MRTYTILFVCCGILLAGCFEEIVKVYDGPPVVEFEQYMQPYSSNNNYTANVTFPFEADDDETISFSLRLNLISAEGTLSEQTSIGFDTTGETTAQEGADFTLNGGDHQAIFPANEVFSSIDVELSPADLMRGGEAKTVEVELTSGDVLSPSENYKTYRINFGQADVQFDADLQGLEGFEDIEGSISLAGNTPADMFTASISLGGLEAESTYSWALYEGTCDTVGDLIGAEEDYPAIETGQETQGSWEAEIDQVLDPFGEIHVQVSEGTIIGDNLVVCGQIN